MNRMNREKERKREREREGRGVNLSKEKVVYYPKHISRCVFNSKAKEQTLTL